MYFNCTFQLELIMGYAEVVNSALAECNLIACGIVHDFNFIQSIIMPVCKSVRKCYCV